jgi:hypothetical protein
LINVVEKIAFCNKHNHPALLIAIDQSKAFDKLSHSFMTTVYKFFNFGENFVSLLDGIGTGRTASLLWEDGSSSVPFELKSGRAQGDGPSPLQYNFAEQILLYKIELDPNIRPVVTLAIEAARIPDPLPWFSNETCKKTNKTEALADDTTVLIDCDRQSLFSLHATLVSFEEISGLACNFDKTCVLPIGGIDNLPFDIADTGLKITNSVKLLGLNLDNKLECLTTVHDNTYAKISAILDFWGRFYLSLPGRINIVKTLCFSQINYLGSIITPTAEQKNKMEKKILTFVKGTANIGRDRFFDRLQNGGLGLFDVDSFLSAQQTMWLKRILYAACDIWREEVYHITFGNPCLLDPSLVDKTEHPILYNIAESFKKFKSSFYKQNDNYKKSHILFNPNITRGRGDKNILNCAFFSQNPPIRLENLAKITFSNTFSRVPLQLETVNVICNINLNLNTYLRLTGALSYFANNLKANRTTNGTSLSISDFFGTFKKGSKSIRSILVTKKGPAPKSITQVKTFFRVTNLDLNPTEDIIIKQNLAIWSYVNISNDLREFIFKFFNNSLGLNTRVSHFVADTGRNCTFCVLKNILNEDETFEHLFYSCTQTSGIRDRLLGEFWTNANMTPDEKKRLWFGYPPNLITNKKLSILAAMSVQFCFWKAKLKKKIPMYRTIKFELTRTIGTVYRLDKKIFSHDLNFALSRNIDDILRSSLH